MAGAYPTVDTFTGKTLPNPARPITDGFKANTIIFTADSGQEQRRKKGATLGAWEFVYNYLTDTQYKTLRAFFISKLNVESFSWSHPVTKTTYTVRFNMDTFQGENAGHNVGGPLWKLSVKLVQVL